MENDVLTVEDREAIAEAVDEVSDGSPTVCYVGSDSDYTEQLQTIHEDLEGLQEIGAYLLLSYIVGWCNGSTWGSEP